MALQRRMVRCAGIAREIENEQPAPLEARPSNQVADTSTMGSSAGEVPRARREVSRAGTIARADPLHRGEAHRTGRIGTTDTASLTKQLMTTRSRNDGSGGVQRPSISV